MIDQSENADKEDGGDIVKKGFAESDDERCQHEHDDQHSGNVPFIPHGGHMTDAAHLQYQQIGYALQKVHKRTADRKVLLNDHKHKAGDKEKQMIRKKGEKLFLHKSHTVLKQCFLTARYLCKRFCKQKPRCDKEKLYGNIPPLTEIVIVEMFVKMKDDHHDGKQKFQQVDLPVPDIFFHCTRSFFKFTPLL